MLFPFPQQTLSKFPIPVETIMRGNGLSAAQARGGEEKASTCIGSCDWLLQLVQSITDPNLKLG
jgi:hypothetical protein